MIASSSSSPRRLSSSAPTSSGPLKQQQQRRRKKKKRLAESLSSARFRDIYYTTGEVLGEGSYGRVETCVNMFTDAEYAVKVISKANWCFSRSKVLKEIELYYLCRGRPEIIQLVEYYEEPEYFYLIFEKARGGPLLDQIQRRVRFTEEEAAGIVRSLAGALAFLHGRGIAHRDLKPDNVLCMERAEGGNKLTVKLCDFDLCSSVNQSVSTPLLQSPVGSAEYMAPEVVNAFSTLSDFADMDTYGYDYDEEEDDDELTYDKKCDLWSLGIIAYILLCGYLPFSGRCNNAGGDCGWESGGECLQCQRSLFDAIRSGTLVFPEEHWSSVSTSAKELISRLLVKEAAQRLDAAAVLEHPWVSGGGSPKAVLETPSALRRQAEEEKKVDVSASVAVVVVPSDGLISGGALSKGFSEFASSALNIKRTYENSGRKHSRAMRRSATSQDFFLLPDDGGGGGGGNRTKEAYRKTSAAAMLNTTAPPAVMAHHHHHHHHHQLFPEPPAPSGIGAHPKMMRRQTSLIFPEEINNNDRCEV